MISIIVGYLCPLMRKIVKKDHAHFRTTERNGKNWKNWWRWAWGRNRTSKWANPSNCSRAGRCLLQELLRMLLGWVQQARSSQFDSPCWDTLGSNAQTHNSWNTAHREHFHGHCFSFLLHLSLLIALLTFVLAFWIPLSFTFVGASSASPTSIHPCIHPFIARRATAFAFVLVLAFTLLHSVNLRWCRSITRVGNIFGCVIHMFQNLTKLLKSRSYEVISSLTSA